MKTLGRIGTPVKPNFKYAVRAYLHGGYIKDCSIRSDVELSDKQAITSAKRIMGECYGLERWEVERV